MNSIKVILGTLAGLSIGAIIGIMYAPNKGSTTRRYIIEKGDGNLQNLKEMFDEFTETISDKFEKSESEVNNFIRKSHDKIEAVKK